MRTVEKEKEGKKKERRTKNKGPFVSGRAKRVSDWAENQYSDAIHLKNHDQTKKPCCSIEPRRKVGFGRRERRKPANS